MDRSLLQQLQFICTTTTATNCLCGFCLKISFFLLCVRSKQHQWSVIIPFVDSYYNVIRHISEPTHTFGILTFRAKSQCDGTHSAGHLTFRSTFVFPVCSFSISFCEKYSKMKYVNRNRIKFNFNFSSSSDQFCTIEPFKMMQWNLFRSNNRIFLPNYR